MDVDEIFMKKAISLARKGLGSTSPNPLVGALVVKKGEIVSAGYHKRAGLPHAEIAALSRAGGTARGSTLYVNLEPCNHYGRTPPCTKEIIKTGIQRVVVGIADPNPHVAGGGCDFLRTKGVRVRCGVLEEECRRLNEAYIKYITKGKPFVVLKSALTLDGRIATRTGDSKWITGERSRKFVHTLRKNMDAVMVGVGTVIRDDPLLTPYMLKESSRKPVRVIVDTRFRIPLNSRVLNSGSGPLSILAVGEEAGEEARKRTAGSGVRILACRLKEGRIDLSGLLARLADMSVTSVMAEGGGDIYGSLIREKLVDKYVIFIAPKIICGEDGISFTRGKGCDKIQDSFNLDIFRVRRFDKDIMIEAYPRE